MQKCYYIVNSPVVFTAYTVLAPLSPYVLPLSAATQPGRQPASLAFHPFCHIDYRGYVIIGHKIWYNLFFMQIGWHDKGLDVKTGGGRDIIPWGRGGRRF